MNRETMEFDVVIVGAGPAGLATACRLGQLAAAQGRELAVAVLEKAAEIGGHIVSGAVIDTRALAELFPDWAERGAPLGVAVREDAMVWLPGPRRSLTIPAPLVPGVLHNRGHRIASLGRLCQWLGDRAEELGCHIFPGFAATEVLYGAAGEVVGVATGPRGLDAQGRPKPGYEPGYELRARYVVLAEGCRGSLGKELEMHFGLRSDAAPQRYGLGFKEIWNVDPHRHREGHVLHSFGWPLDDRMEGGGFLYHAEGGQVYLGFVLALNYRNPHVSPFEEFQRWKQHPRIRGVLDGGTRIAYGARAVNKGGLQSLPKLTFPGGLLVGCEAGFLNPAKIKGTHTAIKSGLVAAEALYAELGASHPAVEPAGYADAIRRSWLWDELVQARNFSPALARFGTRVGAGFTFLEHTVLRGHLPLTLRDVEPDHRLRPAAAEARPSYPKPDQRISFDRLSSVFLCNTSHPEDQPVHLKLADPLVPVRENLPLYDEPAQRYCPAAVYEVVEGPDGAVFRINPSNCIHCKTCDIKDPAENITWVPPEGGSGPNYVGM